MNLEFTETWVAMIHPFSMASAVRNAGLSYPNDEADRMISAWSILKECI